MGPFPVTGSKLVTLGPGRIDVDGSKDLIETNKMMGSKDHKRSGHPSLDPAKMMGALSFLLIPRLLVITTDLRRNQLRPHTLKPALYHNPENHSYGGTEVL